ncbi:MAG: ATP-binding protein [Aquabacterium sp.]
MAAWTAGALMVSLLDGHADLGSLALPLVLAASACGMWWPMRALVPACVVAAMAFNWFFVDPRGTFHVSVHRDALLLLTMLCTSLGSAWLTARQAHASWTARTQAERTRQLLAFSHASREDEAPAETGRRLMQVAQSMGMAQSALVLRGQEGQVLPSSNHAAPTLVFEGSPDRAQQDGLMRCMAENHAFGPGTGRHDNQPAWYLPLPGTSGACGAAMFLPSPGAPPAADTRQQLQALCDLAGHNVQRLHSAHMAEEARQRAQDQAMRNTLLASVSHDYRTPLATIMGAASSLHEQQDRLQPGQQRHLAAVIMDEVMQLSRLTDNALQLARLDTPHVRLNMEWESMEELAGAVLRRSRHRAPGRRIEAVLTPGLPLLRCDAVLIVQLLDNLIDNALKYTAPGTLIRLVCEPDAHWLRIAVEDEGPGVPEADRARIFQPFERGRHVGLAGLPPQRGAGLGLALCQAIATAHGGSLTLHDRSEGGCRFEVRLPCPPSPALSDVDESPRTAS